MHQLIGSGIKGMKKGSFAQPEELTVNSMMLSELVFRLESILAQHGDLPCTTYEKGHARPVTPSFMPRLQRLGVSPKGRFLCFYEPGMDPSERVPGPVVVRL